MIALQRAATLIITFVWFASSAGAQTTAQDIVGRILGQGTVPLVEVDINADGVVNAHDLTCFHSNCNPAAVAFELGTSEASEGQGQVQLQLVLSRGAFCTLMYTIDGPATAGSDYVAGSGTIQLAGAVANIPISLIDDASFDEELEPLIVSIRPGPCYQPGAQSVHTLHLVDNDRPWFGTLEAQVPGSNPPTGSGDLLGFRVNVVRTGAGTVATLFSDGGTMPPGSWPIEAFIEGPTTFSMSTTIIPAPAEITSFASPLNRQFAFAASSNQPGQEVAPGVARGTYVESIASSIPAAGHLGTTVMGRFSLLQSAPRPSSWQPPLDPSP